MQPVSVWIRQLQPVTQDLPPVADQKTQRRFQFSLRKLLLWMAVCAEVLGLLRWAELPTELTVAVELWLGMILVIRLALPFDFGVLVAVAASACFCTAGVLWFENGSHVLIAVFLGGSLGGATGISGFHSASLLIWIVDRIDTLLTSKSSLPSAPPESNHDTYIQSQISSAVIAMASPGL
jgi:hypothetical protein